MKKTLMCIVGVWVFTATAMMRVPDEVIPGGEDLRAPVTTEQGQPLDDLNVKRVFFLYTVPSMRNRIVIPGNPVRLETIGDAVSQYDIPAERMAKMLEDIIRESLAWEKKHQDSMEDDKGFPWGYRCIPLLATYGV